MLTTCWDLARARIELSICVRKNWASSLNGETMSWLIKV